ncbi:MAG: hypothetical protein IEMM0008_0824 [bacterium]|nr:MAG: hypothetical protein IEMM0008_0824 [bacterium]
MMIQTILCNNFRDFLLTPVSLIVYCCVLFIIIVSHFRFVKQGKYRFFDLFSNFILQYCIFAVAAFLGALWTYDLLLGVFALYIFVLNISVFLNGRIKKTEVNTEVNNTDKLILVYLANIWCNNSKPEQLQKEISPINPGCVFLMEIVTAHIKLLDKLINQFPHKVLESREDTTGFIFLSLYPIIDVQIINPVEHGNRPLLKAQIKIGSTIVSFYGVHPHTPITKRKYCYRNNLLKWLAANVSTDPNPVIVVGDFNTTTFSPVFRQFLVESGLIDTRNRDGFPSTWPKYFPLLWLPLDHVLVNSSFNVLSDKLGRAIGSDHFAKIVTLSFSNKMD